MVTTFWLSPFHARRLSRYNAIYTLVALVPQQASDEGLGLVLVGRRGKTSRARSGLHTRVFLCDPSLVCKLTHCLAVSSSCSWDGTACKSSVGTGSCTYYPNQSSSAVPRIVNAVLFAIAAAIALMLD